MEALIELLEGQSWFGLATAIIAAASIIAAATPTPEKGTPLSYLYWVIDFLAVNIVKAKETGEKVETEETEEAGE